MLVFLQSTVEMTVSRLIFLNADSNLSLFKANVLIASYAHENSICEAAVFQHSIQPPSITWNC